MAFTRGGGCTQHSKVLKFVIVLTAITFGLHLLLSVASLSDILHSVAVQPSGSSSTAAVSTVLGDSFNTSRESQKNSFFNSYIQPPAWRRHGVVLGRRLDNENEDAGYREKNPKDGMRRTKKRKTALVNPALPKMRRKRSKKDSGLDKQLEDVTKSRFVLLAVAALPTVLVLYHFGDASPKWCSSLKISYVVCVLFSIFLIITDWFVLGLTAVDLNCGEDRWKPMIKPIGDMITVPVFGKGRQVRVNVRRIFGPLLFMNMFAIFGDHAYPEKTMPTMDHQLSEHDLDKREWYFIPRYIAFLATLAAISELLWLICSKWQTVITWVDRMRRRISKMHASEFHVGLLEDEAERQEIEDANPPEPQANPSEVQAPGQQRQEQDPSAQQPQNSFDDEGISFKGTDFGDALHRFFNVWYASYQVLLYVWTDIVVSGGLVNPTTGTVWEMWSLPIQYACIVHLLTILIRYLATLGVTHQHPTTLIFTAFLPWVGNEMHIWKDHATQGLAFSVAHCLEDQSPALSGIGLVLGYYGFFATFYSVYKLLEDRSCKNGLIMSHWPVAVAAPMASTNAQTSMKPYVIDMFIGMNTKEKQVRAWHGELPHLMLHFCFIYFFGGSKVIYASVLLSFVKIAMFPVLTWFIKLKLETWGCSENAARRYLMNIQVYDFDDAPDKPLRKLAKQLQWYRLLEEFYGQAFWVVRIFESGMRDSASFYELEELSLDQMVPCAGAAWMGFTAIIGDMSRFVEQCLAGKLPPGVMSYYVDGKGRRWMHIYSKYSLHTWGGLTTGSLPPDVGVVGGLDHSGLSADATTIKEPYSTQLYDDSLVHLSATNVPLCWRLNLSEGNHVFRLHLFDPWLGGRRRYKLVIHVGVDNVLVSEIITPPRYPQTRFDDFTFNLSHDQGSLDVEIYKLDGPGKAVVCGFEVFKK